jgi:CHAT domain-containing protein/Tfp pilus assembly protein PilF
MFRDWLIGLLRWLTGEGEQPSLPPPQPPMLTHPPRIPFRLDSSSPFYYPEDVRVCLTDKDLPDALRVTEVTVERSGGHPNYLRLLDGIYLRMGHLDKAIETFERIFTACYRDFPAIWSESVMHVEQAKGKGGNTMITNKLIRSAMILVLTIAGSLVLSELAGAMMPTAYAAPPTQEDDATLLIINESEETICYVIINSSATLGGGEHRLDADEIILPGKSRAFDLPKGEYSVILGDCERNVLLAKDHVVVPELYELRFTGPDPCLVPTQEGVLLYNQAQYQDALPKLQDGLACYREVGDRTLERSLLNTIGVIYNRLEQYEQALVYYEEALSVARDIGDRDGEGLALDNIAVVYLNLGQHEKALDNFKRVLSVWREIGHRDGERLTLNHIGDVYDSLGQYEDALMFYEDELIILREIGDRAGEAEMLNRIGVVYHDDLRQYEQALAYFDKALMIAKEIGNQTGDVTLLNDFGSVYNRLSLHEQALDSYEDVLSIRREIGDRLGEGETLNNIGYIYDRLGRYEQALEYCEEALSIWREIGDRTAEGETLNRIGMVYAYLDQYERALAYSEEALSVRREVDDRAGEGHTLHNIGVIYNYLGQYEQARAYLEEALSIRREVGDRTCEGTTLNAIGATYVELGQYEQALAFYEDALDIRQEIGDRAGEGHTLQNIGMAHFYLGQYEQALAHSEEALIIRREIGDRAREGETLNNIGLVYSYGLDQQEQGLDYYEDALTILKEIGDRTGERITLGNIGAVYYDLGQYEQALDYFERAVAVVEVVRGEMTLEEFKSSFAAASLYPYQSIIPLLIEIDRPAEAFGYVQRAKARTFLDQLANVRIDPRASDDPALLAREQELLGEIRVLEDVLFGRREFATLSLDEATRSGPPALNDEQRGEVQARLDSAYREYEQILIQIKLTNPQYAGLRSVQASTLITIQQTLPPDVTLLEYYVAPTQTLAFVVTPRQGSGQARDDFHVVPISVTVSALSDAITWFRGFPSLEGVPQASQELHELLFAPVCEYIHTDALFIAPHGVLHYLPFGALHDGEGYLVEDYAIAYLPSASVLQYVLDNVSSEAAGDLLALANPKVEGAPYLNHAVAETEAVAALFDVQPIVGPDATESLLVAQAPQAGRVHVAAHGEFKSIAPQFSRIYLAPDDENDGYLEVREVFNLELPQTDLVTLSACETQLGELSAGDELVGLSRAFIYAGTPSLVAGLWSVNDESTRFLMERFYGYLRDGRGKASALRQAQLDTMAKDEWVSPYYWAAFTLIGDMGEVEIIEDRGEAETTKETRDSDSTEDISEIEIAAASDRTWLWVGGVALLLVVVGGGVWLWGRRR